MALKDKLGQLSGKLGQLKGKLGQGRPADPGAGKGAGVLATKDIVEKIFAEAKKKVGDVPNVSAVLVENAGNKYNFDTKMQSIVHLNWLKMNYKKNLSERYKGLLGLTQEGGPEKDLTLDEIIQTIAEKNDEFVKVAQNVLAKETENKDDYFVFYHSCQCGPIVVLFEIYQFLYSWGMMKNNQPLAFRFFDINMEEKKDNVIKNFNILKENTKKIEFIGEDTYLNKYSYKYKDDTGKEYKEKGASVDMIEPFVNFLLSVNLAFFGNYGREVEQTFHYFKEGGSITPIAVDRAQKILQPISERLKIPSFNDKMTRIINEFIDLPEVNEKNALGNLVKKGALFQIFIKKNEVDQVAYWTLDGGFIPEYTYYTKDFELLSIGMLPRSPTTPEEKEKSFKLKLSPFVEKISSLLAMYLNKPDELNERVKVYFQNRHQGDAYFLDLDKLQARIWLASPYLYNPEYTKIFRYSLIDKKVFDDLHKKLTKAFDELIKEFIAKKVAGEKFENLPKAFKKFIDEKIKDIKAKGQLAYNCFCDTAAA